MQQSAWIGRLLWGLAILWMGLGSSSAYGGPFIGPGAYLLWLASFYSLLTNRPWLTFPSITPASWIAYLAGTAGCVVALCHFAASPATYAFWFAGVLSVFALLLAQQTKAGVIVLFATGICVVLFPWVMLRHVSLLPSIEAGNVAHVRLLLLCGADPNALHQHDTPLIAAVRGCHLAIAQELLRHGADPNGRGSAFMNSTSALFEAARTQCTVSILGILLQYKADPNQRNGSGESALFHAIRFRQIENVQLLLQAGAHIDIKDNRGNTPLSIAHQTKFEPLETLLHASTSHSK